jgi:hypothetical protein
MFRFKLLTDKEKRFTDWEYKYKWKVRQNRGRDRGMKKKIGQTSRVNPIKEI